MPVRRRMSQSASSSKASLLKAGGYIAAQVRASAAHSKCRPWILEILNQARDRTTEMVGLARDSSSQTFSDASMSAPISGAE